MVNFLWENWCSPGVTVLPHVSLNMQQLFPHVHGHVAGYQSSSSREPAPFLRNLTNHQLVRSDARPRYAGLCSISGFSNFFNNWDLIEFASSWMWFVIFEMRIRIFRIKNLIFFVLWRKKYLWQVFFFFFFRKKNNLKTLILKWPSDDFENKQSGEIAKIIFEFI